MGFAALKEKEDLLNNKTFTPPANDNAAVDFLRRAVNAPSFEQVKQIALDTVLSHNFKNKIELVVDNTVKELKDSPRHFLFEDVLKAANADIPVALVGPAGSGKSTMVEQIAEALDLTFYLQNAVTGTHELAGYMDAHGKYNTTTFRTAFVNGGFFFIDEVDTSDPGALKWLNSALANGKAMFPDSPDPISRHPKFRAAIGANTFGTGADRIYVGANQLDASTLDRFVFFEFVYDEKLELLLAGNADWVKRVQELRAAALTEKARMVISPRASINGAKLLAIGWSRDLVEERVIWKGTDPELKRRIIDRVAGKKTEAELNDKLNKDKKKR